VRRLVIWQEKREDVSDVELVDSVLYLSVTDDLRYMVTYLNLRTSHSNILPTIPCISHGPNIGKNPFKFPSSSSFISLVSRVRSRSFTASENKEASYFQHDGCTDLSWRNAFEAREWIDSRS